MWALLTLRQWQSQTIIIFQDFTKSADFEKSRDFNRSNEFTKTKFFSLTEVFIQSASFNVSDIFPSSNTFPFENNGQQKGPVANIVKSSKTANVGIIMAIIIGILLLVALITGLLMYFTRKNENDFEDDDNDLEPNDASYSMTSQMSIMANPLYDGEIG